MACTPLHAQEVSLASCVFEGDGLSSCTAGSTASFKMRACDARGYTVATTAAEFTLTVVVDGREIAGACAGHSFQLRIVLCPSHARPQARMHISFYLGTGCLAQ